MAIVACPSLWIPQIPYGPTASAPSFTANALNASGIKFAMILQAPKTGSIRKIHFRTGTVTTATDTDVRVETVDGATGDPSGTLFGTTTNATVLAASITANAWVTSPALTADAAVTQGDLLAIVLAPTGTPNYQVNGMTVGTSGVRLPYLDLGTTYTKVTSNLPVVGLEYSDGSFAAIAQVWPINAINTHTYNNGSTPDEYALKFQLPVGARLAGVWLWADTDGDFDLVLYDNSSTALLTKSFDKDNRQGTGIGFHFLRFGGSQAISANTTYQLAIKPTTATSLTIYSFDVNSAALLDQLSGGQNFNHSTRTDAGAWTDTATRRLFIGLMLDGIDVGSSAAASYGFVG